MTELEKKILLTKGDYDYLMDKFCYDPLLISKQINYYFDTDDLSMNRKNITCRIRFKDCKYTGTLKQHNDGSDHSTETEVACENIDKNAFTDMGLKLQGTLITERFTVVNNRYFEAVLDKNEYLGHTDYELEIEYTPDHEKDAQLILKLFRDMLIHRTNIPNAQSKSKRFFEILKKGKNLMDEKDFENNEITIESSYDEIDELEPYDPDDYMHDYIGSLFETENECAACVHFKGMSCELNSISCEYEQR